MFPLGSPLFPGVVLPLQIFEPRYRRLVADLVARPEGSGPRSFGVVAIRQGWEVERVAPAEALFDVGCTAVLRAVTPQSDGGYRLVTVGADRFRLLDVVVADDPPYLQAEVEWLGEEEAAEEAAGDAEGLVTEPGTLTPADEDVAAEVAKGSLDLLVSNVSGLFARYVTEVAALRSGGGLWRSTTRRRPSCWPTSASTGPTPTPPTGRPRPCCARSGTTRARCPTWWRPRRC